MAEAAEELFQLLLAGEWNASANRGMYDLICKVARTPAQSVRFRELVNADTRLSKMQVKTLMKTMAVRLEQEVGQHDGTSDLLDRYVAPVCASAVVAGIISTFVQEWDGGPVVASFGALVLLLAATMRFWVKNRAISARHEARLIELLTDF